jgi:hypothetical protein
MHRQRVAGDLLYAQRDAVAVHRPHSVQRLQDHQVERALQDLGSFIIHRRSSVMAR